ncbi:Protein-L-isoaspartate O-methyltransferase [subsurface metagenome]
MQGKTFFLAVLFLLSGLLLAGEEEEVYREKRDKMVRTQIQARDIRDEAVLQTMRTIPRHKFVPQHLWHQAYADHPLPIGEGQTISQPYIVALMTEYLDLKPTDRVLEIGTGSGYQAAVLSGLVQEVYTIEIKQGLHKSSTETLQSLGYENIKTRHGDGYFGWEEAQPFDSIMITAAVDHIPPPLLKQLKEGGRLILPLGTPFVFQNLVLVTKKAGDYRLENITGVLFVPMTGEAMKK